MCIDRDREKNDVDGALQAFTADGKTTYVEQGRSSQGEWSVIEDGRLATALRMRCGG
jgi:hypothetical protein